MKNIFTGLRKKPDNYDLWKLVDQKYELPKEYSTDDHFLCDIDKTYLETDFESLMKMARIFVERPSKKITVDGAAEVLRCVRWGKYDLFDADSPSEGLGMFDAGSNENQRFIWDKNYRFKQEKYRINPLHFVSSSPPQMRKTLEEKLAMDGLDFTSVSFKNQVYNIRKWRFDLLRQQVAYKTAAIVSILQSSHIPKSLTLIGDNSESDPLIYLGIKLLVEKRLDFSGFVEFLKIAGIPEEVTEDIFSRPYSGSPAKNFAEIQQTKVDAVFIRKLPNYPLVLSSPLTDSICYFDDYFQVVLLLMLQGKVEKKFIPYFVKVFHNRYGYSLKYIYRTIKQILLHPAAKADESFVLYGKTVCQKILDAKKSDHTWDVDFVFDMSKDWMGPIQTPYFMPKPMEAFEALSQTEILNFSKKLVGIR